MSKLGRQDGYLSVNPTSPNQNKPLKNSRLRQESQDDNDTTALFQHSPESNKLEREYEAGCLPDEVYDRTLPGWRAGLRRFLTRCLKVESEYLASMQVSQLRLCDFSRHLKLICSISKKAPDTRAFPGSLLLLDGLVRQ